MKRWLILTSLLATRIALAQQAPAQPPPAVTPPFSVDPSTSGLPPPPPSAPRQTAPPVVVVGANGQVLSGDQNTAPTNFYVDGGDNNITGQGDTGPIHTGPTPELHVVRSGDTLWDICAAYFNDPWQWPKIWSYNPQITNPHWIYPGDLVRLLPRGVFAETSKQPDEPAKQQPDRQPDQAPPAKKTDVSLKQLAFVEQSDLDKSITIDGSVEEKNLLGTNDEVYLSYPSNKPPQVGEKYSIYIPDQKVGKHGAYVRLLGTVEVVSVKQDKRARGIITEANHEIERGAKVGPLMKAFKNVPPVAPKVDAQGAIVAMIQRDQLVGQGEVVFVSLGKSSGVEVGNRMFIVRRGDGRPKIMSTEIGQDDRRFPARALGELVIVEVGENISVGLITLSVQEMSIGDIAMMQKAN